MSVCPNTRVYPNTGVRIVKLNSRTKMLSEIISIMVIISYLMEVGR